MLWRDCFFSSTEQVTVLSSGLAEVRKYAAEAFGVDPTAEFHGHEIMNHEAGWSQLRGKTRAKLSIYRKAMAAIGAAEFKYFIRGVHKPSVDRSYTSRKVTFHELALQYELESLNDHARAMSRSVVCIADDVQSAAEHQLELQQYQRTGTPGYRPTRLEMITAPINFVDSRLSPGIQATDLLAYAYQRAYWQPHANAKSIQAARDLFRVIPQSRYGYVRIWQRA